MYVMYSRIFQCYHDVMLCEKVEFIQLSLVKTQANITRQYIQINKGKYTTRLIRWTHIPGQAIFIKLSCILYHRFGLDEIIQIARRNFAVLQGLLKKKTRCCTRMMTSSNGNIFCVTGPLCGEFTGHRWIPLTKASDAELDVSFHLCLNKWVTKQWWFYWFETP